MPSRRCKRVLRITRGLEEIHYRSILVPRMHYTHTFQESSRNSRNLNSLHDCNLEGTDGGKNCSFDFFFERKFQDSGTGRCWLRRFQIDIPACLCVQVSSPVAAIIYTAEPLWGAGLAYALLGERWGALGWVGAALVIGSSLAAQLADNKRPSPPAPPPQPSRVD